MASGKTEYGDIFDRPHHVSTKRPQMSRANRAAQFSPFAALTGYDSLVAESARTTDRRVELSEDDTTLLSNRLQYLREHLSEHPTISIVYFEPDSKKVGGAYIKYTGTVRKVRDYEKTVLMEDGREICFSEIISLTGDIFLPFENSMD